MMLSTAGRRVRSAGWLLCCLILAACSAHVTAPPEPPPSVRRGDQSFRFKEYDAAVGAYRVYLDEVEQGEYTPRVFYKSALAQFRLERYADTLTTLDELAMRYPKTHWVQVDALRGDAELASGHNMAALHAWDSSWEVASDADRQKLRLRIMGVVRRLNDVELAQAHRLVNSEDVRHLLDRQIAMRQPAPIDEPMPTLGDADTIDANAAASAPPLPSEEREAAEPFATAPERGPAARGYADKVEAAPPREPLPEITTAPAAAREPIVFAPEPPEPQTAVAAARPQELAPDPAVLPISGPGKIGCLLPLTGPAKKFGERSLRGVRLALGQDADGLVIKDTGGDPAVAQRMFEELRNDPNVLAVVGPLRGEEADGVARRAEQTHVPLLLLSPRDGLSGRYVLQAGMTRSRQVSVLLDYAMGRVRLRRFGVVYPNDPFGKEFLAAFRADVERRGGAVVGVEAYPAAAAPLSSQLASVRKWRDGQNVQAVFLPDAAPAAAQFAQALQSQMPDVTLLGVHGWENLADHGGGGALNGILFTDGFYAGSARPETRDFVEHFQQAYSDPPGVLEAQAYDAATLAQRAVSSGAHSRAEALSRLQALGSVEGASGTLRLSPDGLMRSMFLLQVYDGKLKEISAGAS